MIITIAGAPGSGKTSAGKILAAKLGMPFYSVGGLRAKMALDRGMTIDELNRLGETDKTTDTEVDDYQRELGEKDGNFVIEGRLSWHFIPNSFKVFLDCDPAEAARRIYAVQQSSTNRRADEPVYASAEEAKAAIIDRVASDVRRYAAIYGVDYRDTAHYDLVFDTTHMAGPEDTAEHLLAKIPRS